MRQMFPVHPDGFAGAGLLLLRVGLGLRLVDWMLATAMPNWGLFLLSLSVLALLFGLGTRFLACLSALLYPALLLPGHADLLPLAAHAAEALAVAVLGPGAFSIDALRFGRSTLSSSRRHRTPN